MARSKQCLNCAYSGPFGYRSGAEKDWRTDVSCDYLIITGKLREKGDDLDHCLLFEQKSPDRRNAKKKLY